MIYMRLGLEIDEPQEVEGNFYYQLGSLHGILPYGNQTIMGYKQGKLIVQIDFIFYTYVINSNSTQRIRRLSSRRKRRKEVPVHQIHKQRRTNHQLPHRHRFPVRIHC